jgi:hypothetical protein
MRGVHRNGEVQNDGRVLAVLQNSAGHQQVARRRALAPPPLRRDATCRFLVNDHHSLTLAYPSGPDIAGGRCKSTSA